ncbi:MAG: MATE family efflux transporter [Bacteroidota bacterium]
MKQNYKAHLKKNLLLAYPVMISQVGHMMVNVADSVMVGQLGALPLAGASLANVIFHLLMTFGIGISYAITPLVAAADGEGNYGRASEILKNGFLLNGITGVLLFMIVFVASPVLYILDQPKDVVDTAVPYLNIITLSLIPLMVFQTFRQFAEGLSKTRQAMFIVIASNLINIGLNYVLIYGKVGFPALGLNGAGWASFISRIILALSMMGYIYFNSDFRKFRSGFSVKNYSRSLIKRLASIGLPAGLQFIFEVGAFGFAVIMMGWISTEALAAHQIAVNLAAVSYMAATGLSAAATIRVGNQLGKKDIPTLRAAVFTLYGMVVSFMLLCALIFFLGRQFLPELYIQDTEVITIASSLVVIAGFFQLSDGVQVVSLGALRGLQDVKIPTALTFIAYWIIALPVGYVLAFQMGWGAEGIWYGLFIGLTIVAIVMSVRFNKLTKMRVIGY